MNLTLIKGQEVPLNVESSWLFIESYQGKLSVRLDATGEEFTLPSGSVLRYGKPMGRILLSGEGELSFEHGSGDFTPPVEGQKLEVTAMPKVELEDNQQVVVSKIPKMEFADNQTVRVHVGGNLIGRRGELPLPIPANANRKGVIIKAPSSNTGFVSIEGFELAAGETVTIETTAAFELSGKAPDTAQLLEY
ncbi:hypothetical protein LC147_18340 [Vibrio harveyi]|uniref:hypothetical protein n=1 Tax=Vibrio harveyi TaxID=669 RepID=UPI00237FB485|nr:hypothetical protein [Vibrio harveyi]HDM8071284.1 hypothetical protein [Vibrio harveyi]